MSSNPGEETTDQPQGDAPTQRPTILGNLLSNRVEAALYLTRLITVVSCVLFLFPLVGGPPSLWYQRALVASAATSALRLHQRLAGQFRFSREAFARIFTEDACHYLIFTVLFISSSSTTMALIPVFLFALLNAANYTDQLLNMVGSAQEGLLRRLLLHIKSNDQLIFRFIAVNEILLMPVVVLMLFSGAGSIFIPFLYYRFLTLRYASRRNRYCRQSFHEMRLSVEQLATHPRCPTFIRNVLVKSIELICRLAPENVQSN